jgi:hypothetical protein
MKHTVVLIHINSHKSIFIFINPSEFVLICIDLYEYGAQSHHPLGHTNYTGGFDYPMTSVFCVYAAFIRTLIFARQALSFDVSSKLKKPELVTRLYGIIDTPVDLEERLAVMLATLKRAKEEVLNLTAELTTFDRLHPQVT